VLDDITAEKRMEEFFKHKERVEAMGELSASIAHEIRNPLASIRGAVQEISRSVEIPEDKRVLIEIVLSESDRLDQIISDFLRYARMRRPKVKKVDIGKLLTDLRLLLIARPESRDYRIQVEDPENLDSIPGDAEQLRQVFLNLSVNALQAMDACDEKRLSIRAYEVPLHEVHGLDRSAIKERVNRPGVCVEVADTGPGMPDDVRRQIFEPFFTTKSGGTGLGLAIVARIVQGHEGVVVARPNDSGGTVFLVWIPSDLKADNDEGPDSA
jgi:two-component system sensor histidine kinase PilS (NtrC family)